MAWIETTGPDEAKGKLRKLYDAAIARAGRIYQIVRMMSPQPDVLESSIGLYSKVMFARGGLSRAQREMLAVVVSKANGCHY